MHVFFDDSCVFGKKEDHLYQLQMCLQECHINGISLNLEKCVFCINLGTLLGHIVCSEGLLGDPRKVTSIMHMLKLMNATKVLGIVGFYQRHFRDFVNKLALMCKFLNKDEMFNWTKAYSKALKWLKSSMTCLSI